ncbi:TMAO reductase system periplasmic protein TorT [Pseudodesulfovibrio sp. zrk46]|nr:TMAO reductase system periplasmic protein TorT [Pseudodesulfovibrio sp. zrk46]
MGVSCVVLLLVLGSVPVRAEDEQWWPIQVKSYYGEYEVSKKKPGRPARSFGRARLEEWAPPMISGNYYRIGVSFPHMKDDYWVAVNYGIIQEARRLGIGVDLREAGGYTNLKQQIKQLRELARSGVDGILVGAISYDGLDDVIREIRKQGVHVVGIVNGIRAPAISAKAMVSYYDMGFYAGEFVVRHAEQAGKANIKLAFFPGPKESSWAPDSYDGFTDALKYYSGKASMTDVRWGDTGRAIQWNLIEKSLNNNSDVDYLVGNAVAAEAAADIVRTMKLEGRMTLVSTYLNASLYDKIADGRVAAAPSDLTVFQGRMAVDMLVRLLNGEQAGRDFPFRSGPFIPVVTTKDAARYPYEGLFGPRRYQPIYAMEPKG